jgi:hypothetical protein
MHKTKIIMLNMLIILNIILVLPINVESSNTLSHEQPSYTWNSDWSFYQEILIPIQTNNIYTKFQPIDIKIEFENDCWAKDQLESSIRVCCWFSEKWYELESQIYQLNYTINNSYISDCRIIFLIPDFSNGEERYFIYYDEEEKPKNNYIDHIKIEDAYYYYEPITGLSVEGDYYKITEDEFIIYGVGQKGQVMNRKLSQIVIKMKPNTKEFDIMDTELLASFSFSYHEGVEDTDEVSSDQVLISKEIFIDGNLMTEFGIISESSSKNLRTTNIYKYYYCPTENKKIIVDVKHEIFDDIEVKGIEEIDGRYCNIISYQSKSSSLKRMIFGEILPYVHIYGQNNRIKEYQLNLNPETKDRDWVISHQDDCDLGNKAWLSYDNGEIGKSHGIIFSSNKNIVKQGSNERDGVEITVAEKEYLNIVGTEIDYVSIGFGRNSFVEDGYQDLSIPKDLIVEFSAEFITIENDGYGIIDKEAEIFQKLIKNLDNKSKDKFEGHDNIYTLTVIPHLTGKILSYPNLLNFSNYNFPIIEAELYQNNTIISKETVQKPILGPYTIKFPKLSPGLYVIKIYRKFGNNTRYIGFGSVDLEKDVNLHIYCTWEKTIKVNIFDQNGIIIEDLEIFVYKNNYIVNSFISNINTSSYINIPFNLFENYEFENINNFSINSLYKISKPYVFKAYYKGFLIIDNEIKSSVKEINIEVYLNELLVNIKDRIGFDPGVDIDVYLTSKEMKYLTEITPKNRGKGKYLFHNLPSAKYDLYVVYGSFFDKKSVIIPDIGKLVNMEFNALYNLKTDVYNSIGEIIDNSDININVIRNRTKIFEDIKIGDVIQIPPGKYTINIYQNNQIIGSKSIDILNNKNIKIVTTNPSIISVFVSIISISIIAFFIVLFIYRRISINTFLKIISISLILFSLFQPWWMLNSTNEDLNIEKTSSMYIFSYSMIDKIIYNDEIYLDLATIPEEFTEFLVVLIIILYSGLILMSMSFLPNIFLRRRFSLILVFSSILFIILVNAAFTYGMLRLSELSLGSLQGNGILDLVLPNNQKVYMNSTWGLGFGFYICIISSIILIIAGFIDFLRRKEFQIKL